MRSIRHLQFGKQFTGAKAVIFTVVGRRPSRDSRKNGGRVVIFKWLSDPPALRTLRFYALPACPQQCIFEGHFGSQPDDVKRSLDGENWG